jgi:hypothetical protein
MITLAGARLMEEMIFLFKPFQNSSPWSIARRLDGMNDDRECRADWIDDLFCKGVKRISEIVPNSGMISTS